MKPRIFIDARMVGDALHGVARYVTLLARGLAQIHVELPYEPVFLTRKGHFKAGFHGFETREHLVPFLDPREQVSLPLALREGKADFYHSPSFASLAWCPCPWLVTVHDLNHLQFGGVKEKIYYSMVMKPFARRARALLTVSEFSRKELAKWLDYDPRRIEVVPNALEPSLTQPPPEDEVHERLARRKLEPGEYFLCLSNPKAHKNVSTLVRAYQGLRAKLGDEAPPLVLNLDLFDGVRGVRALGRLPEADARALLAGAKALFFPSLYEGFGLPPLEAAVAGIPVALSHIPPHEEALAGVPGDQLAWVEPLDLRGWIEAFELVLSGALGPVEAEFRELLASRYDVQHLGQGMDRVYRRVIAPAS